MNFLRLPVALLALCSTAACATVTRGTSDTFTVSSTPPGAAVKTSNGFACDQTPCSFKMSRKSDFTVNITKPGYKPWSGHITNKVATEGAVGVAGNVLVGGLIGIGVDAVSGAALDLTPNPLAVTLDPAS
jgi:hypothetical protein